MNKEVESGQENLAGIQDFVARYSFPIDQFQLDAIAQLAEGQSVLVAAPTGTGKTLVAEYAIWQAQQRSQRVIYTTPLKALSNQKHRDLREVFGQDAVGLVTGDIVEHSHASIVVMTTEVYRNMLLEEGGNRTDTPSSLADVGFVVFDELHYLSDIGRGPVWEEAIICSPPHVQLVGLSATVSNAEDLASWISRVHRPISLIVHEQRAVPLEHFYFLDGKLHLVQDADGKRIEHFPGIGGEAKLAQMAARNRSYTFDDDDDEEEDLDVWDERRRKGRGGKQARQQARQANGQQEASASQESDQAAAQEKPRPKRPAERKSPLPAELLTALRDADMLPCLYFLPGRRVVEEAAMSTALHHFTTPEEEALIKEEIGVWMEHLPQEDHNLQQVHSLLSLLPRGLAFHHAGLLPGLKVLVETLFSRGFLRAVFATDTLALGINMPARSVVVGSLSKFDGQEMRLLTPNEYRQLTGRAGRRGMDVRGSAIIPYSPWEPFEASFQRITGELLPVTSSFVIRYNSVLNLWRSGDIQHLRRICASSLREYQRYLLWELSELHRLETRYQKAKKSGKRKKGASSDGALQALEKRREKIGAFPLSRAGAAELDGTVFSLRALGYIGQDDELTLKGRLLRSVFHPAGIAIVELISRGMLDEISANELAEVFSWFTYDNDRRLNNRNVVHARLVKVRRELWQIAQHISGIEDRAGINPTPGIVPEFHGIALAWARGTSLTGLLHRIDLAEGDILMILNQTIDLLQQLQAAVGQVVDARDIWEEAAPIMIEEVAAGSRSTSSQASRSAEQLLVQRERLERLRPLLAQAAASLFHGIIVQSRTVPSMVARIGAETVPLDAEEDRDAHGLNDGQTFVADV
ncbi:MAG: DEAD/DEAH box helicase [Chloroflexota bacterium]|nr:DEAD/DEAH box helicase [Chloroflexota bacterium]